MKIFMTSGPEVIIKRCLLLADIWFALAMDARQFTFKGENKFKRKCIFITHITPQIKILSSFIT